MINKLYRFEPKSLITQLTDDLTKFMYSGERRFETPDIEVEGWVYEGLEHELKNSVIGPAPFKGAGMYVYGHRIVRRKLA
jgi:hypothetical protein